MFNSEFQWRFKYYLWKRMLLYVLVEVCVELHVCVSMDADHNTSQRPRDKSHSWNVRPWGGDGDVWYKYWTHKKRPRVVHIYTRANTDGIEEDLETFSNDFHASCESKSTSENWTLFKDTLTSTMTKYIPTKIISGRWNLSWMNGTIKRLIKKRT